jgi:hypothetical protein
MSDFCASIGQAVMFGCVSPFPFAVQELHCVGKKKKKLNLLNSILLIYIPLFFFLFFFSKKKKRD